MQETELTNKSDLSIAGVMRRFTVDSAHQQELISLLKAELLPIIEKQPGCLSVVLQRAEDGSHVIILEQWRGLRTAQVAASSPEVQQAQSMIQAFLDRHNGSMEHHMYLALPANPESG